MLECLPRVASLVYKGYLLVGHGSSIEVYDKADLLVRIPVFEENGANVYGIVAGKDGVFVHGERGLARVDDSVLFGQSNPPILVKQFHDQILTVKSLSGNRVVILFTCNTVGLYEFDPSAGLDLRRLQFVQSEHCSVLLRGHIVGDDWENVYTIVGTVFGVILVSKPSEGSSIVRKYAGHTGMIFDIVLDGSLLYTVSDDRSLRIWPFSTEPSSEIVEEMACEYGHSARPFAIAIKEQSIYTAGIDQTVCKWFYREGALRVERKFPLNIGCIRSLTIHHNQLYCCSENGGLVSFDAATPSQSMEYLPTCEDLRGFARAGKRLYTVNSRGKLFLDGTPIYPDHCLRYLISSPSGDESQLVVAYGDKSVLAFDRGTGKEFRTESRILGCVCAAGFAFAYSVDRTGVLYQISTGIPWNVSFAEALEDMGQKKPLIPSSMAISRQEGRLLVLIGSVCGHIMTFSAGDDPRTAIQARTFLDVNRHFKGEQVLAIETDGRRQDHVSCLVKNVGIIKWIRLSEEPYLQWISTTTPSTAFDLDCPSRYCGDYLAGFHSTDFHLLDQNGLSVFDFPCGGGNRPWNCYFERDGQIVFEFIKREKLIRVSQPILSFKVHHENIHRAQIILSRQLVDSDRLRVVCTGSNDTTMVLTSICRETGRWKVLKRMADDSGFLCVDSYTDGDSLFMATGCAKGRVVVWKAALTELLRGGERGLEVGIFRLAECRFKEDTRVLDIQFDSRNFIAAALANGTIEILSLEKDRLRRLTTVDAPDLSLFTRVRWMSDGNQLVAISTSGKLHVWDFDDGKVSSVETVQVAPWGLSAVDVASNLLAVGEEAGRVTIFKWDGRLQKVQTLEYHNSTVTDVKFSADMAELLSTSLDCRLAVHQLSEGTFSFHCAKCLPLWDPSHLLIDRSSVVVVGSGISTLPI